MNTRYYGLSKYEYQYCSNALYKTGGVAKIHQNAPKASTELRYSELRQLLAMKRKIEIFFGVRVERRKIHGRFCTVLVRMQ